MLPTCWVENAGTKKYYFGNCGNAKDRLDRGKVNIELTSKLYAIFQNIMTKNDVKLFKNDLTRYNYS